MLNLQLRNYLYKNFYRIRNIPEVDDNKKKSYKYYDSNENPIKLIEIIENIEANFPNTSITKVTLIKYIKNKEEFNNFKNLDEKNTDTKIKKNYLIRVLE